MPLGYLKLLNSNGFRLIRPPPRFVGNSSLLRHIVVFHDTCEDVRCRYDPITAAGFAEDGQRFALRLSIQFFIGIIRVQNLDGETLGSERIDRVIGRGLMYARDGIDESLSTLLC